MPNLFSITTTTNTLRLDEKRQGDVTFTVSNASEHPMRGRALLQPEDPKATAWLHLEGDVERDFPETGTERYTATITVPQDAPPGSYAFRLDMVNAKRPDEDYTRGQTITIEVPEAEPKKKPFPWWKALVATAVLLLGALVIILWPDHHVTGTVTDAATGEPLAGATVVIAETNAGTTSDIDGTYRIEVDAPEATLIFSFAGYLETRLDVGDEQTINVRLVAEIVDIDFTSAGDGSRLGISLPSAPTEAVIRNARELGGFAGNGFSTLDRTMRVDFEEEMVILASQPVNTTGHSLRFEEVRRFTDEIVAQYAVTTPGENCFSSPATRIVGEAILVPHSDLPVVFLSRRQAGPAC